MKIHEFLYNTAQPFSEKNKNRHDMDAFLTSPKQFKDFINIKVLGNSPSYERGSNPLADLKARPFLF